MNHLRPPTRRVQPWLALALGLGYLVTWTEILEQHYYRARFSWWQMYLPVILTPLAILAALLRAISGAGFVRLVFKQANSLMVTAEARRAAPTPTGLVRTPADAAPGRQPPAHGTVRSVRRPVHRPSLTMSEG
jgi:hypothetical protein